MKKILSIALLLFTIGASAQRWARTYSLNSNPAGFGKSICSDSSGNIIVVGVDNYTKSILLKYDISGNLLWADTSTAIDFRKVICSGDDIYVTGKGNLPFIGDRMVVGKWNSSGQNQWLLYDTISVVNDRSTGYDLKTNSQNELIAVGEEVNSNVFPTKLFLMNISLSGNLNWSRMYTVPQLYTLYEDRFITDAAGDIYLSRSERNVLGGDNYANALLFKYDHANGNLLWSHELNVNDSTVDMEGFLGITSQGTIVQIVTTNDSLFNPVSIIYQFSQSGNLIDSVYLSGMSIGSPILNLNDELVYYNNQAQLMKIDLTGAILGSVNFSGIGYFVLQDLKSDNSGNIYMLGEEGIFCVSSNYSVAKFDSSLNLLWADTIDNGNSNEDVPYSFFIGSNYDVMATGFGNFNCPSSSQDVLTAYWSHSFIQGINNPEANSNYFEIYPNPGKTEVNYKFSDGLSNKSSLSIYGMTGNLVHQQEITSAQGKINIDFTPGVYIVKVSSQGNELVSRLVVE